MRRLRRGLAHRNGDSPVYPASVPKFVYLMAAYAWRDQGRLEIDPAFERVLRQMIYVSSNRATQHVVRRLTETEAGPRLAPEPYAAFRERRHRVKHWLQELGIEDLHTVHPTYDGGGDLYGRDLQFLEDPTVPGSLPDQKGPYCNRQAMTANATARLLALLATDLALSPESSAEVREQMRRDPRRQPLPDEAHRRRRRSAPGPRGLLEDRHLGAHLRRRRHRAAHLGPPARGRGLPRGPPRLPRPLHREAHTPRRAPAAAGAGGAKKPAAGGT